MLLALSALAAAAASYAGYATMAPESQLYGRTLTHGSDPGQMALTFDDGPNEPHTLHLLEMLAEYEARATFFVIGKYVRRRPEIVRTILSAGHAIGNHTESHPNLILVSAGRLHEELESCKKALEDASGESSRWFRPPFGGRRPNVLRTAQELGMESVMWSVSSYDWNATSSQQIVEKITRQVEGRSRRQSEIILLHDGGHVKFGTDRRSTLEATRKLLERYSRTKEFVSIADLARV